MKYKIKWRAGGAERLQPETFDSVEAAKTRARELLSEYGDRITIDVWNEHETWQIVSPTGVSDWIKGA
jgi:hypothetical protein